MRITFVSFWRQEYPIKTNLIAFVESLSELGDILWTKLVQPNTLGETWNKGSFGKMVEWGIRFLREEEGILFIKKLVLISQIM